MSFLNGLRGMMGGKPELPVQWNIPETENQIDELFQSNRIQVIYKHSFSCSISIFAKNRIEADIENLSNEADFHFVDVRINRSISNYVAEKSGVHHESPQLLIIRDGKVLWNGSHNRVQTEPIKNTLNKIS